MKIRHEYNLLDGTLVNSSTSAAAVANEFINLDTTTWNHNFNQSVLEVVYTNTVASGSVTLALIGNGTQNSQALSNSVSSMTLVQLKASGNVDWLTLISGTFAWSLKIKALPGAGTVTIKAAKLIIYQDTGVDLYKGQTRIELGDRFNTTSVSAVALSHPKYWKYNSANWDGTLTVFFEATAACASSKSATTIALQVDSAGTFASWTNVTGGSLTFTSTSPSIQRTSAITLTAGRNYRVVITSGTSKSAANIYNAAIIMQQVGATKLEEQYLLLNTLDGTGTALQTFLTSWNSSDWDARGGSITYTGQAEAAASSTSVVVIQDSAGTSTVATISSPNNAGTAAATMPSNQNLDFKASTNNNDVFAVRILVAFVGPSVDNAIHSMHRVIEQPFFPKPIILTSGMKSGAQIPFDIDAHVFIAAAAITNGTQKIAINNLVVGLKNAGLWSAMNAVYPFVGGTAASHKFNLKNPVDSDAAFRLTFVGSITHSSGGIQGDGSTGCANTHLNPSSILSLNSTHISIYSRTNNSNASMTDMGCGNLSSDLTLSIRTASSNLFPFSINSLGSSTATTDSRGLYAGSRINSTNESGYWNGALQLNQTTSSAGPPNGNFYLCAFTLNDGVTPANFCDRQYAFATIGSGLSDTDMSNLYIIVQTYQTALGRQV